MAGQEFEKDFGYLMPFLDKVAAAAGGLADPAAREELTRIMSDEKARWSRVRQLLAGGRGAASPPPQSAAASAESPVVAKEPLSFTVGSLRPGRSA
jgi:hypothetical protein